MTFVAMFLIAWAAIGVGSMLFFNPLINKLSDSHNSLDVEAILLGAVVGPFMFAVGSAITVSEYGKIRKKKKKETERQIEQGILLAEGIPDPSYVLCKAVAAKILQYPEKLLKKVSKSSITGSSTSYLFEHNNIEIEYAPRDRHPHLSKAKIDGEELAAAGVGKKVIVEACEKAIQLQWDRAKAKKLADLAQKACDQLESIALYAPPKEPKKPQKVVESCEFSCCNPVKGE